MHRLRLTARVHAHTLVKRFGLETQARTAYRFHVRRPADERHIAPRARQHAAVIAADRAGTHDGNFVHQECAACFSDFWTRSMSVRCVSRGG